MSTAEWLRVAVAIIGVVIIIAAFLVYCNKKLSESHAFAWGLLGLALFVCSVIPGLSGWSHALASNTTPVYVILGVAVVWILFTISVNVSSLQARNQELAMQVSLLNYENERVLKALQALTGEDFVHKSKFKYISECDEKTADVVMYTEYEQLGLNHVEAKPEGEEDEA